MADVTTIFPGVLTPAYGLFAGRKAGFRKIAAQKTGWSPCSGWVSPTIYAQRAQKGFALRSLRSLRVSNFRISAAMGVHSIDRIWDMRKKEPRVSTRGKRRSFVADCSEAVSGNYRNSAANPMAPPGLPTAALTQASSGQPRSGTSSAFEAHKELSAYPTTGWHGRCSVPQVMMRIALVEVYDLLFRTFLHLLLYAIVSDW
jgi:hypothetical protein